VSVLVLVTACCLPAAFAAGLVAGGRPVARALLLAGLAASVLVAVLSLPSGIDLGTTPALLPGGAPVAWRLAPAALWLYLFGAIGALAATASRSALASGRREGLWYSGVALSLVGAVGTFAVQDGVALLVSWEIMSLGGAFMLLCETPDRDRGMNVLFMLGLLEFGSVALMGAVLWLGLASGGPAFAGFHGAVGGGSGVAVGLLLLLGFGAKLGLLPFYEWFPGAYESGSGATGAVLSGVVLNAAFFGLARGLVDWTTGQTPGFAYLVLAVAVGTSILTALYAFQQDDWRGLLAFSSAENGGIAVTLIGAVLVLRDAGLSQLAALAWGAALIHLAGHALAKSGLFLTSDRIRRATGSYGLTSPGIARLAPWAGAAVVIAGMSLAAVPPTPGFISEWFGFQTLFNGFNLDSLSGRIALALSGAGLALTAAIALATFVKVLGLGLLGRPAENAPGQTGRRWIAVPLLAGAVLVLAIGMPWWLAALDTGMSARFGHGASELMRAGWLLVPLTPHFAFISPTKLAIAIPLYALVPVIVVLAVTRMRARRVPVWYGGLQERPGPSATTSLTFSNALRRYYSFVYRPRETTEREHDTADYFLHRLTFSYEDAPIFGPWLFSPVVRTVHWLSRGFRALQSGYLNFYLALIGAALMIVLVFTLA